MKAAEVAVAANTNAAEGRAPGHAQGSSVKLQAARLLALHAFNAYLMYCTD